MVTGLRRWSAALVALAAFGLALVGIQTSTAAPAKAVEAAATTVCYDASGAGVFQNTAHQAASIWNNATNNVYMSPCGTSVQIYITYSGGSRAYVYGLGRGVIYIDYYQAQQYSPLRIMTHEMGHILGLPDNYNGDCSILMSGGSAGTSCTNPYPSAGEAAQVDYLFSRYGRSAVEPRVYQDSWPAAA